MTVKAKNADWFADWFNSPYYHVLYQHRDEDEAVRFIDNLLAHLKPADGAAVLDLACGKGRHAIYLAEHGLDVTGIDLAEESIKAAKTFEHQRLHFFRHDMREVFQPGKFDIIFNFFTSFGYFKKEEDNFKVIQEICTGLKADGMVVIDFLNARKVLMNLGGDEQIQTDNLTFHISRKVEEGRIIKSIDFEDEGRAWHFEEQLQALELPDFERYFHLCGLELTQVFGDYQLHSFDAEKSDRLIMVARKTR